VGKLRPFIEVLRSRYFTFSSRVILGAIFIVASIGKLPQQAEFADAVVAYDILPTLLARWYGLLLPWAELLVGGLLILGFFQKFIAGVSVILILSFIIANSIALSQGMGAECGCFGGIEALERRDAILVDALLLLMSFQILFHKRDFLSLDSWRLSRGKVKEDLV